MAKKTIKSLELHRRKSVSIKIHEAHKGKDFPRIVHDKKFHIGKHDHGGQFPRVIHTKGKIPSVM